MLNKRGQGLSTSAIVLIILGVVVLVILVLGFMMGWDRLFPFLPSDNVETIKTSCASACATGNTYGFCGQERTLKADGLPKDAAGNAQKEVTGNCSWFSSSVANPDYYDGYYKKYGIEDCPSIDCS